MLFHKVAANTIYKVFGVFRTKALPIPQRILYITKLNLFNIEIDTHLFLFTSFRILSTTQIVQTFQF